MKMEEQSSIEVIRSGSHMVRSNMVFLDLQQATSIIVHDRTQSNYTCFGSSKGGGFRNTARDVSAAFSERCKDFAVVVVILVRTKVETSKHTNAEP